MWPSGTGPRTTTTGPAWSPIGCPSRCSTNAGRSGWSPLGRDDGSDVAFVAAPVVELTDRDAAAVAHLGPDLCRPDPDLDEAVRRMGELCPPDRPIGMVLLDQRVAAGIGNIYKSEACFAYGIDP